MGSNVTLLSSVLPESRVRGCRDATHSASRETVFGRRQQRRAALSVTCINWVRPSISIRPLSRQKRFTWNQATPMKRFGQRCTQIWILPVSVSRLSCHRKLKTTPLLHSVRGAVTRPTEVSRSSATAGSSSRDSSTATQRCQRLHEAGSAVLRGEVGTNDHSKTVGFFTDKHPRSGVSHRSTALVVSRGTMPEAAKRDPRTLHFGPTQQRKRHCFT